MDVAWIQGVGLMIMKHANFSASVARLEGQVRRGQRFTVIIPTFGDILR